MGKRSYPRGIAGEILSYRARGVQAIGGGDQVESDRILHVEHFRRNKQRAIVAVNQGARSWESRK